MHPALYIYPGVHTPEDHTDRGGISICWGLEIWDSSPENVMKIGQWGLPLQYNRAPA